MQGIIVVHRNGERWTRVSVHSPAWQMQPCLKGLGMMHVPELPEAGMLTAREGGTFFAI